VWIVFRNHCYYSCSTIHNLAVSRVYVSQIALLSFPDFRFLRPLTLQLPHLPHPEGRWVSPVGLRVWFLVFGSPPVSGSLCLSLSLENVADHAPPASGTTSSAVRNRLGGVRVEIVSHFFVCLPRRGRTLSCLIGEVMFYIPTNAMQCNAWVLWTEYGWMGGWMDGWTVEGVTV
jgi:hypothetical protein